jgi:hypothetical protein
MNKSLLLRKCGEPTLITFHLFYDTNDGADPEALLIEKDLLAPLFDTMALHKYTVECRDIRGEFPSFGDALARYYELVINWKAIETYVHPVIFRWDKKWREGVQYPQ